MTKLSNEILDKIPFDPVPDSGDLRAIQRYLEHETSEFPSEKVGQGASRTVYALPSDASDYVIKVQRLSEDNAKYGNQNMTEIKVFLQYDKVRPWLPQIYSFDSNHTSWIVAERCILDRARLRKQLNDYSSNLANQAYCRLKEHGVNATKVALFAGAAKDIKHLPVKDAIKFMKEGLEKSSIISLLHRAAINNPRGEALVDALLYDLQNSSAVNIKTPREKTHEKLLCIKGLGKQKKLRRSERKRLEEKRGNPWQALLCFISMGHPLIVDLAREMFENSISFHDLHEGNLGLSQVSDAPYNLKIVDMGIVRKQFSDTPTNIRQELGQGRHRKIDSSELPGSNWRVRKAGTKKDTTPLQSTNPEATNSFKDSPETDILEASNILEIREILVSELENKENLVESLMLSCDEQAGGKHPEESEAPVAPAKQRGER